LTAAAPLATVRQWWGLAVLLLPALLVSMDISILFIAGPAISRDLAPSATQWLWMMDSYSLVVAALLVTMGSLADRIGRRRLLLIGSVAFGAASALLASASSPELFVAGRVLLAVGAATLAPSTLALVRSMFRDADQRRKAVAAWTVAFTGGAVLGPVLGGLLLERFHWGSVFLINLPVMVLLLVAAPLLIPESKNPGGARFDIPGALLSLISLVALVYAMKRFAEHGSEPQAWIVLSGGLALLACFIVWQRRAVHPLIDVGLFRRPAFAGAALANLLATVAMTGLGLLAFALLQSVHGMSPLQAGLVALPTFFGTAGGAVLGSALARRIRPGAIVAAGLTLAATAMGCIAFTMPSGSVWVFLAGYVVLTFGIGMVSTLANSLILTTAPREQAGAAASISETAIHLGSSLGIAGFGTISATVYQGRMEDAPTADVPANATESIGAAEAIAAELPATQAARLTDLAATAFSDSVAAVALAACAVLVAAALVTGTLLRRVPSTTTIPDGHAH
jgi:DHA2 family multidrug resistance protein-like MFS transporter